MELNTPPTPAFSTAPYCVLQGRSMGTSWIVKYVNPGSLPDPRAIDASIQNELDIITCQMSTWDRGSTISHLNGAETGWYQLPEPFFYVLEQALNVAQQTGGAYDPTVGELVDLWGFGPAGACDAPPSEARVETALSKSGWHRTQLNQQQHGVWQPGGLRFDLSSIAKGYGADRIAAALEQYAVEHYLVELGGELKARGRNRQGAAWSVAIEIPDESQSGLTQPGASAFPLSLENRAIATSGDYRRYFQNDGRRYAHTLDAVSGQPLSHNLASVSVVHRECMMADALATALLCLGPEKGPAYARAHNIAALFMHRHPGDWALEWTDRFRELTGN